jgi:hypothetical protein
MKTKVPKAEKLIKASASELLSLTATKLSGKVLFPQQVEAAKTYLQKAKAIVTQ